MRYRHCFLRFGYTYRTKIRQGRALTVKVEAVAADRNAPTCANTVVPVSYAGAGAPDGDTRATNC